MKKVPAGFKIEKDVSGDGQIVLVKTVDGAEVAITFEVNDQPDQDMPDMTEFEEDMGDEVWPTPSCHTCPGASSL